MNRAEYADARRGYRLARRRDIEWREPESWAYRERTLVNQIPAHPRYALRYITGFDYAIAETFFRPLVDANRSPLRLPAGPKARAVMRADASGFELAKRVALRAARRQIAALEAARNAA